MSDREQEIIAAYEQWEPDEQPISELVERLSISRQRLYGVLERNHIVPKSKRARTGMGMVDAPLMTEMAEMALGYLLTQLQEARDELARYREGYGPL
jgi:hypothetical protein